jgi:trans-aconitate methyltransferase
MRYQDYVIKDGVLVGDFDEMYRLSDTIPWNQDVTAYSTVAELDLRIISAMNSTFDFTSVIDVGCGLGYFTNRISSEACNSATHSGVDISAVAISSAKQLFSDIEFNILGISEVLPNSNHYSLATGIELHWYLLDNLEMFRENKGLLAESIYIRQSIPHDSGYLGEETFPSLSSISSFWASRFEILFENHIVNSSLGSFIGLFMQHR